MKCLGEDNMQICNEKLNRITAVQECDAKDDDSSNGDSNKKIIEEIASASPRK